MIISLRVYVAGHTGETRYRQIVTGEYGHRLILVDPIAIHGFQAETTNYNIPEEDKELILSCDILVAYIRKPTYGTVMEVIFAYENGIPVLLIDPTDGQVNVKDIWLGYHVSRVFPTIVACFEHILDNHNEYENKKQKKEIDMAKDPEVSTRILGKHYSPLIIRKTNKFGFPLYVGFICDYDMSDLDEVIEKLCVDTIADSFNGDEDEISLNPQAMRNFAGELTDRFVKYYNAKHINCVEGVAVIFYADKMFISSLFGDFMNHAMCRQELYFALNFMTGV